MVVKWGKEVKVDSSVIRAKRFISSFVYTTTT
jgi:hypothetical protein